MIFKVRLSLIYIILIFLLFTNQALINYYVNNSIFVAWKQVLLLYPTIWVMIHALTIFLQPVKTKFEWFFVYLTAVMLSFLLYAFFMNIIGWAIYRSLGIWLFLFVVLQIKTFDAHNRKILLTSLAGSVSFVIIGIIVGWWTGWFSFIDGYVQLNGLETVSRASFFTGSSTLLFPILSSYFLVWGIMFRDKIAVKWLTKRFTFILALFAIMASILSGSRSSLMLFLVIMLYLLIIRINWKYLIVAGFFIIGIIKISLATTLKYKILYYIDRWQQLFDVSDAGNRGRMVYWNWLMDYDIGSDILLDLFGHGIGYLLSSLNRFPTQHFESSLISIFVEGGLVGVMLLFVIFYSFLILSATNKFVKLWLLLLAVLAIFVPSQFNYVFLLVMGIVYGMDYRSKSDLS